jgi:hypothetical protein
MDVSVFRAHQPSREIEQRWHIGLSQSGPRQSNVPGDDGVGRSGKKVSRSLVLGKRRAQAGSRGKEVVRIRHAGLPFGPSRYTLRG